ncbi:MAG: hypothetical protein HRT64_12715 [Erythrobacter sp.]|nr:hypothetical protein [Erythrobacter sp.]
MNKRIASKFLGELTSGEDVQERTYRVCVSRVAEAINNLRDEGYRIVKTETDIECSSGQIIRITARRTLQTYMGCH